LQKGLQPAYARIPAALAILGALVLTTPAVEAQVLYGALTGTVVDSTGAVIAGAQVTAVEVETGVSQTAASDASGIYRFATLLPGTYKVTINAAGFAAQETNGVQVQANEIRRLDASLKVGSATQSVTVTTAPAILQTDKADVHTDISAQEIGNLPIMGSQGRNFQSLLKTVTGTGLTAETNSLAGNPQRASARTLPIPWRRPPHRLRSSLPAASPPPAL
jgi:hypothetical protein